MQIASGACFFLFNSSDFKLYFLSQFSILWNDAQQRRNDGIAFVPKHVCECVGEIQIERMERVGERSISYSFVFV